MVRRWPVVVGIIAICGGIAWFALRRPAPAPRSPDGPASQSTDGSGKAAIRAPLPPVLDAGANGFETPRSGSAAPDAGLELVAPFAAQDRDPGWAAKTEAEIKRRFRVIGHAGVESIECRHDQCLIVLSGTQDELGKMIAEIDSPRGLHGFAENILLSAPEQKDGSKDGKLVLRAYAMFAR